MTGTGSEGQFSGIGSNYSGGTTIAAGSRLVVMDNSTGSASTGNLTAGPFGTGPITLNDASIRATTAAAQTIGNGVTLQGNLTMQKPGNTPKTLTFSGPVTIAGGSPRLPTTAT